MTIDDEHRAMAAEVARAMARGFALAIVGQEYKSVRSIVGDYAVTLTTPVAALFNGSGSINTVRATFNRAPKEYARDAYIEGMAEGKLEESDMDADDEKVIAEWLAVQAGAVGGVVDAIREAGKAEGDARTGAQRGAFTRVGYWVDALAQLGALGRARALDGVMAYWALGDTETHCDSCLEYAGLDPHRMKWWRESGRLPKSHDLDCGGYNCDCTLRNARTRRVIYP